MRKVLKWDDFYKDAASGKYNFFNLFFLNIKEEAINFLKASKNGKDLLEIGCADGLMYETFSKIGFDVVGIDINSELLFQSLNKKLVCGDIHQLPFKEKSFDYIYSFSVLQYCNHSRVFSECRRILKDSGKFAIIENMGKNPFAQFYRFIHNKKKWKYPPFQTPVQYITWEDVNIKKYFPNAHFIPYHLTTPLVMIAFRILPTYKLLTVFLILLYYSFSVIDKILLFLFPFAAKYCWRVLIYSESETI